MRGSGGEKRIFYPGLGDRLVNITPVAEGSALAWRDAQVWLGCRPFLKLMGDHETRSNIHFVKVFLCFFFVLTLSLVSLIDGAGK